MIDIFYPFFAVFDIHGWQDIRILADCWRCVDGADIYGGLFFTRS